VLLISPISRRPAHSVNRWQPQIKRIHARYNDYEACTDAELRKQSLSLRYRAQSGEPLERLLIEAFALVRQAAERRRSMAHFDVQLLGGMAMQSGAIAVMQTGEGKTLTATLPLYLAALTGRGAHLITANDYLAERDAAWMRPVFEFLGMRVGVITASTARAKRRAAYHCDITYATAKEVGFDFLRDRLIQRRLDEGAANSLAALLGNAGFEESDDGRVQRELNFALVDEADSILIDEARTPLIISSLPGDDPARSALYTWCAHQVDHFEKGIDFDYDFEQRTVVLTAAGRRKVRQLPKHEHLSGLPMLDIYSQVELALFVEQDYVRDRHYVIRDGEVVIVDEFTGRTSEGRKWRSGLHQAIEAREGVEVTRETCEAARITIQDLFLRYNRLCGMTGTVANSARELKKIYDTGSIAIPTNKPPRREQWKDRIFRTEREKWQAIVADIQVIHETGRPILVGTRSIDKSEVLAHLLQQHDLSHDVLNARHLSREAEIVAAAGQVGKIVVATNMAGRGTDIQLSDAALKLGGLHVIGSELHESARIDRQLFGRCGRQGDPGSFQLYISLEDDILRQAFGDKGAARVKKMGHAQSLTHLGRLFRRAQAKLERRNFRARKMLMYRERQRQSAQREMGQDPYVDTIGH